jgi:hypothetical protein
MSTSKVSIIIPIIREKEASRCVDAVIANVGIPPQDYEIVTAIDKNRIGAPGMIAKLIRKSKYDLICFLGDDTIPQKDFLKIAIGDMRALPGGIGVVGFNTDGNDHAHFLAHKKFADLVPGGNIYPLDYEHCFGDDEIKDIAIENNCWAYANDAKIEHVHPIFGKAEYDEHYQRAYEDDKWARDAKTYRSRKIARMKKKYGVKLGLCYPLVDIWNYTHFTFSNLNVVLNYMADSFNRGGMPNIDILMPNFPGTIQLIRNDLVTQALNLGCTHVLMMDTDQIYEDPDTIQRLLDHDLPVVGTMVHRRYPPYDPLLMRGEFGKLYGVPDQDIEAGGLINVTATGCGCILYSTQVFLDIGYPWYEVKVAPEGHTVGEDIGFCKKLGEIGTKIYVDADIKIKHLSTVGIDWDVYKVYKWVNTKKGEEP